MDDALRARLELLEALVLEMYRCHILTEEMIDRVAERFSAKADRSSPSEAEIAEHAAHMATMISIEASALSQERWEAERSNQRADERRSRLHVVPSDGGNPDT